jgi:NTP pyrophosphatase (non-canonical NTP hydrolase)
MNEWAEKIYEWCEQKGWNKDLVLGNMIANLHTEISEAWEEIRNGHAPQEVYYPIIPESLTGDDTLLVQSKKPEGFPIEIADLVIRVLHLCKVYGIDIDKMVELKMAYNETRSYRHGGKTA